MRRCAYGNHGPRRTWCRHPDIAGHHASTSVPNSACISCRLYTSHSDAVLPVIQYDPGPDCLYRGDVIRSVPCSCPSRLTTDVYACERHGECVLNGYDRENVRAESVPIKTCETCANQCWGTRFNGDGMRVGMLMPCLNMGGVERWLATLAHYSHRIQWSGVGITDRRAIVHPEMWSELSELMPITFDARQIVETSDVLIIWTAMDRDMLNGYYGDVIHVIHGESDWSRTCAAANVDIVDLYVGVSESASAIAPVGRRVETITNAVDVWRLNSRATRQRLRAVNGIDPSDIVVGFVGRFDPDKEPLLAAAAAKEIGGVAVYCTPGVPGWERQVSDVCDRVVVIDPAAPGDAYAMADVIVHGSRHEGFGLVYIEALASGVPLVARPCGVLRHESHAKDFVSIDEYDTIGDAVMAAVDMEVRSLAMRQAYCDVDRFAAQWERVLGYGLTLHATR